MAIIYLFDCIVWGLSIASVAESHQAIEPSPGATTSVEVERLKRFPYLGSATTAGGMEIRSFALSFLLRFGCLF